MSRVTGDVLPPLDAAFLMNVINSRKLNTYGALNGAPMIRFWELLGVWIISNSMRSTALTTNF